MKNYYDILSRMPLTTSSVINMHPDGVAPQEGLTSAKLLEKIRNIQRIPPPPSMSFDLYGHPTITETYELNVRETLPELAFMQPRHRRMLIVPKERLDEIARTLREGGADVRISPQYGVQQDPTSGQEKP